MYDPEPAERERSAGSADGSIRTPSAEGAALASDTAALVARYRGGDEYAAEELFRRHFEPLTRLARLRLSPTLARRADPEDIAMSAWRSLFIGLRDGRFVFRRSGDLWRLLVEIALHKLYGQVRKHTAARRAVASEVSLDASSESAAVDANAATAYQAVALADELQLVMSHFDAFGRRALELRLQGESLADIAAETQRSERTVRRTLAQIRERLQKRLEQERRD